MAATTEVRPFMGTDMLDYSEEMFLVMADAMVAKGLLRADEIHAAIERRRRPDDPKARSLLLNFLAARLA